MQGFYQRKLPGTAPVGGRERKQNWAEGDASCNEVPGQALGTQWGALEWRWSSKVVLSSGRALAFILMSSVTELNVGCLWKLG